MKQKMVIKFSVNGKNSRWKALMIAAGQPGVESVALQGEEKDQLVVIGDGIDSIVLTILLRKSMGYADILSIGPPDDPTVEEMFETRSEPVMQVITWPPINQGVRPYYTYEVESYNQDSSCTIL